MYPSVIKGYGLQFRALRETDKSEAIMISIIIIGSVQVLGTSLTFSYSATTYRHNIQRPDTRIKCKAGGGSQRHPSLSRLPDDGEVFVSVRIRKSLRL